MRVYTPGRMGFVSAEIAEAVGLPSHVRQARVLIFASSKTRAAVLLAAAPGCTSFSEHHPDFRSGVGDDVDAFREAGVGTREMILVLPNQGGHVRRIVEVTPDGPRPYGELRLAEVNLNGAQRWVLVLADGVS